MAADTLTIIAESLASAVEPVEIALTSPEMFNSFMLRLGWQTSGYIGSVKQLGGIATTLSQLTNNGLDSQQAVQAIALLVEFFDAVKNLNSATDLPGTIDPGEFTSDFPQQLTDYLVANYLLNQRPVLGAILLAGGVITRTHQPAAGKRPPYERLEIAWSSIGDLLNDALSTLRNAYGWGTSGFAQQSFIDNMVTLGNALAFDVFPHSISQELKGVLNQGATSATPLQDFNLRWKIFGDRVIQAPIELGVDLFVLPPTASAEPGIAVSPYARGLSDATFDISDSLAIILKGVVDISKGVLVSIRPGQNVAVTSGLLSGSPGAGGEFSATMRSHSSTGAKVTVLGSAGGSRFEYSSLDLTIGVRVDNHGSGFYAEAATIDGDIVISSANADGFVAELLPSDITVDAALKIGLDSRVGAYLGGSSGLEVEIPSNKTIGPLKIVSATASVKANGGAVLIAFGATCSASIGPLTAQIDNVGLMVDLSFPGMGGNIGPINAAVEFKPPDGAGLSIDAAGVTGGGFLKHDPAKNEYSGMLDLQIEETIAVKAIGLLSTRLPDGAKGYSLLIIITVEDFEPIPLGWGFNLIRIGGLLAINRTFDEEALRAGLRNHMLDAVLFPKDPIRNAAQILSNLNRVFPPASGHHLFGPVAQIAWGTPTLITADLAVVLELGARLRLLVLAQISAILPKPDNDLIRLQMDAVGVIDFDQGTAALDATLHDSRLLRKFPLTGDMAMRLTWENSPTFALAVGGLHPAFHPPPNFPTLERITINLAAGDNPRLRCEAYFALTANTVQFGARAELYAAASGFSLQGETAFDVLIQLSPFSFLADFYAQLQLKRNSTNLFKVRVEGALAGPRPLHLKAKATFEILWWDVTIRVDTTLVEGEKPPLPTPVDVFPLLRNALGSPGNWVSQLPPRQRQVVTLRGNGQPTASAPVQTLLHPLGTLAIKQNVVPLDLDISRFGSAAPAGARRFSITSVGLGDDNQEPQPLRDFFAPAQFIDMSDDEKLSRPSFESMTAGVVIGSDEFAISANAADWLEMPAIEFETLIVAKRTGETRSSQPLGQQGRYQLTPALLGKQARFGAAGNSELRRAGKARYRSTTDKYQVAREGWTIVTTDDLVVQAASVSYSEAVQAMTKMKRQQPTKSGVIKIVRTSELSLA